MRPLTLLSPLFSLIVFLAAEPARSAPEPAPKLEGYWTWRWEDDEGTIHKHLLNVERAGNKLAASERLDDSDPVEVEELEVKGKEVSFVVPRGKLRAAYFGKFASDDTINGEVQITNDAGQVEKFGWTAKRQPKGKTP
jgi:hypothetical protein